MELEGNPVEFDRHGLPLRYKLPLLISVLLAALVAACVIVAYHEVRESAMRAANERLQRIASDLAQLTRSGTGARQTTIARVTGQPALIAALQNRQVDDSAALRVLRQLRTAQDSSLPIELWNTQGERIARDGPEQLWATAEPAVVATPRSSDSLRFHPFVIRENHAYYWITVPVQAQGRRIGTVAQLRRLGSPQTEANIARLFGSDIRIAFADSTMKEWVSVSGRVIREPKPPLGVGPQLDYSMTDNSHIGYFAKIDGTPWSVVVETPVSTVLARPRAFVRQIIAISLVLLAIGTVAAWLLAQYVTAPLAQLTRAATRIAKGDYAQRVSSDRGDELGAVAFAFNAMAEKVDHAISEAERSRSAALAASNAKSEFLATMSHEIRTPINAMIGYADLLEYGVGGPVTPTQQEHVQRIKRSGRHLVGLVDDVLDFAKIESGQLRVNPQNASALAAVETAASLLLPLIREKGLDLQVDPIPAELSYFGDPQRVEQILVNLISNAVKFTEPGGRIRVRATHAKTNGSARTIFIIEDNGIGIAEDHLARIFEPFVQGEQGYTRRKGGSGLGLTISRRLARLMRGDVDAAGNREQGAMFTLTLPAGSTGASPRG